MFIQFKLMLSIPSFLLQLDQILRSDHRRHSRSVMAPHLKLSERSNEMTSHLFYLTINKIGNSSIVSIMLIAHIAFLATVKA